MALIDNLQGYWKSDETSGNASDSSGNANTLTNNATTTYIAGKINNGFLFVATTSQYMSRASASCVGINLSATDFTLNGWVNFVSLPASNTVMSFLGKFGGSTRQYLFSQFNNAGTQQIIAEIGDGSGNASQTQVNWTPSTATWYMVTLRYTNATLKTDFSINGSAQGTQQTTGTTLGAGTEDFRVGAGFGAGRFLNGQMDEWGIWDRRLSDAEITSLYNSGSGLSYPFSTSAIKTINGLATASVKVVNGLAIASVKTWNGLA